MKRFLLLMLDGGLTRDWSDARWLEAYGRMVRWMDDLTARGLRPAGEPLRTDVEGVRVRRREGKHVVSDGPFTEAKEIVGGYVGIECASKDEAVEMAKRCPAAEWGTVEVREIRVPPVDPAR